MPALPRRSGHRHDKDKVKILHAIQSADPAVGGPIEAIRLLAAHSPTDVEHEVLCLDGPDSSFLSSFPTPVTALGPASVLGYSPRLVPWLRAEGRRFDLIVLHGLWRYVSFGSWRALRQLGVPYAAFPHGMLDPWFKWEYPLKHAKKWLFWPWTEYRVLRDAAAVLFTCEEEKVRARQSFWLYRCREVVTDYGVAPPPGEPATQREIFLEAYPGLRGKRIVLFLGRIHPKKGCDLLIDAFAVAATRDPRLHLVFAGPDQIGWRVPLSARAAALGLGDRITWTGMLTGDLKWGAFHAAEVFVLPSHQENFGIAVAEALACGLPVLISDKVQIWREIVDSGAAFAESDNAEGTRRLLSRWIDAADTQREAMRIRAHECYLAHFEARSAAAHFADIARSCVVRPGPAPAT